MYVNCNVICVDRQVVNDASYQTLTMSGMGQQQTFSVFGGNVRFWGQSGPHFLSLEGLLLAEAVEKLAS
jgi:hypothetical protein